jgi:hypothetical protein
MLMEFISGINYWLLCCFTVPTWGPWKNPHLPQGDLQSGNRFWYCKFPFQECTHGTENGQTVPTIVSFASAHQIQGTINIQFKFSVVVKIFVICESPWVNVAPHPRAFPQTKLALPGGDHTMYVLACR